MSEHLRWDFCAANHTDCSCVALLIDLIQNFLNLLGLLIATKSGIYHAAGVRKNLCLLYTVRTVLTDSLALGWWFERWRLADVGRLDLSALNASQSSPDHSCLLIKVEASNACARSSLDLSGLHERVTRTAFDR